METKGILYMVATPIGNLGDFTFRAVRVLQEVSRVYAEDTRVSRKLLDHYSVETPLFSYREAASAQQVRGTISDIIYRLGQGEDIAYLTDAGTPGVSDPGGFLVEEVAKAGFSVVPVPGPSSLSALLSVAGLPVQRPLFVGFLPKKKGHQTLMGKLRRGLEEEVCDALVFFESPERILKLLEELLEWGMPLQVCIGRELTKLHEEVLRGCLAEAYAGLKARPSIKGEFTVLIAKERS